MDAALLEMQLLNRQLVKLGQEPLSVNGLEYEELLVQKQKAAEMILNYGRKKEGEKQLENYNTIKQLMSMVGLDTSTPLNREHFNAAWEEALGEGKVFSSFAPYLDKEGIFQELSNVLESPNSLTSSTNCLRTLFTIKRKFNGEENNTDILSQLFSFIPPSSTTYSSSSTTPSSATSSPVDSPRNRSTFADSDWIALNELFKSFMA